MQSRRWIVVDNELMGFVPALDDAHLAPESGASTALAKVANYGAMLLGGEREGYAEMTPTRQLTFSTGRHCAHLALAEQSTNAQAVLRVGRVPRWPKGVAGSITHTSTLAAAVVSRHHRSVGIDLEQIGRVTPELYQRLFTNSERQALATASQHARDATCLFSAKEAVYKAVYPLVGQYIGFQEAEVALVTDDTLASQPSACNAFSVSYVGQEPANKVMNTGRGVIYEHLGHVMAYFVID